MSRILAGDQTPLTLQSARMDIDIAGTDFQQRRLDTAARDAKCLNVLSGEQVALQEDLCSGQHQKEWPEQGRIKIT